MIAGKRKNRFFVPVLLLTLLLLSGCSPIGIEALESGEVNVSVGIDADEAGEIRDKAKEGAEVAGEKAKEGAEVAGEKAREGAEWAAKEGGELVDEAHGGIARAWLNACLYLRGWAPLVIVGSLLAGYVLTEVFPKNAEIRKFAVVTMCVRIPLVTLIVTYGSLFAYNGIAGRLTVYSERAAKAALPCVLWYEIARPLSWGAAILCVVSIAAGMVLSEHFRKNPDFVKMARSYLMVRIPMVAFLAFVVYPFLYVMLS